MTVCVDATSDDQVLVRFVRDDLIELEQVV